MPENLVNAVPPTQSQPRVLWLQVGGLTAMQAAITLCWVIYKLYLPKLLMEFGFAEALATTLLIIENFLTAIIEPTIGGLSDKMKRWIGTRFPFIIGGVILASALFISIPVVVIFGSVAWRWSLPVVLIAWALAMNVFRSPTICLLGQYATPSALPLAASLLTLIGGLIGAFSAFTSQIILGWGAAITFAIASFVLLAAAAILRFVHPPDSPTSSPLPTPHSPLPILGLIFITGMGVALGSSFLMQTIQKVVKNQFSAADIKLVMFVIALALAFSALPAGAIAVKLGNHRAMLYGITATVGLMMLMVLVPNALIGLVAIVGLVAVFSLIINGTIPYALSLVPPQRAGLGTGMYFGGVGIAASLFGLLVPPSSLSVMTPINTAFWGAIAFVLAGVCIAISTKFQSNIST
ncbi:MAG TPA: MFS transporter [Cyanobacteria bacterium UBA11370]|nr:MFS transporter [Cyanobacteria bacterium UBA11370]HBY76953.1 MFS transporter [Cyanobacteria bacterium UBA11148]